MCQGFRSRDRFTIDRLITKSGESIECLQSGFLDVARSARNRVFAINFTAVQKIQEKTRFLRLWRSPGNQIFEEHFLKGDRNIRCGQPEFNN
ncbi:MAG: hypothetical protein HC789_02360 [Microcoleus sp. CSU_2_2]|nr:hypothetical protein [Microcoleus sp. SU_5_3]NJS09292.1 hypothetical protein [Microcoleus sp. CSU_2_2]